MARARGVIARVRPSRAEGPAALPRGRDLVVVESPAQARTIQGILGPEFLVRATAGHLLDLPPTRLGVDVENGFAPTYQLVRGKAKVLSDLKRAARGAGAVYLATDPDREGEAIAWLLAAELGAEGGDARVRRALLHELTPGAVRRALAEAGPLDRCRFEAQQARRILDRLVGFLASPVLWKRVRRGLSAGRVLSVAVRLVVERERAIRAFAPARSTAVEAQLSAAPGVVLRARMEAAGAGPAWLGDGESARAWAAALQEARFAVTAVERSERREPPPPPFTTASLQQEAARRLGFTARKTMALAQRLYEGLALGEEGRVGLITYPRTDSVRMADQAVAAARARVASAFGEDHLPPGQLAPPGAAPRGHEAVHPASVERSPDRIGPELRDLGERDLARLYRLVWERAVASQMADAVHQEVRWHIDAVGSGGTRASFGATASTLAFAGWRALRDPDAGAGPAPREPLPGLRPGAALQLVAVTPLRQATAPPPRFDEAGLLGELEERGIGRPSTYAAILEAIQEKGYVEKVERSYRPTELGLRVTEVLCSTFPRELEVAFTAGVEERLDAVEAGKARWQQVVADFHAGFREELLRAEAGEGGRAAEPGIACRRCGKPMAVRWGRRGEFLACLGYPACPESMEFRRQGDRVVPLGPEAAAAGQLCPSCGAPMAARRARFGSFLACSRAPACQASVPVPTGLPCPRRCGGQVILRHTQRGRSYYGCSSTPRCDFASWDRPRAEGCPQCGGPFLVDRFSPRQGAWVACPDRRCGYRRVAPLDPPDSPGKAR